VHCRHHDLTLVLLRIEARVGLSETNEAPLIAGNGSQLLCQFRKAPVRVTIRHLAQREGQLVCDRQIRRLHEQVLAQCKDQLVGWQRRRLVPPANHRTENLEMRLDLEGQSCVPSERLQPVVARPRPDVVLYVWALSNQFGDPLDLISLGLIIALVAAPYPVDDG